MKKKSVSKILALGLSAAMTAALLAGCGDSGSGTADNAADNAADNGAEVSDSGDADSAPANKDDVPTLIWWDVGGTPADDFDKSVQQISDYTEEKIGVRLDIKIANWGEYDQKMNTIVNSGEYFDLMFTNNTNYAKFVNLGAFENITDLVQTVTPDLYSFVPETLWKGAQIHGNVYAVPTYKDSSLTQFWFIDDTYVQKYNIDMSSLHTLEDLDPVFHEVKEGEGKSFYPVQMNQGSLWNGFFNAYDGLAAGLQPIGVKLDDESRQVVCTLEQEDIQKNLEMLHKWYVDGIINPDANVVTETGKGNMFGTAQGWPSAAVTWAVGSGIDKFDLSEPIDGPLYTTETIQGSMNAISVNSKYKEEALKVLELMNTDQKFRDMCAYGVEGDHFEYLEDGTVRKLRDDWAWPSYTQGTFFIMSSQEGTAPDQWDEIRKQNEEAVASTCLGFALDITDIQNEVANCNTVWDKYKYDMLTGASDPADAVPKCLEELKSAGLDTVITEAQKQIDEFFQ